jgi:hypothetical protein
MARRLCSRRRNWSSAVRARISAWMVATSTAGSAGWMMYASAPAFRPVMRSSLATCVADKWMIGRFAVWGRARSVRHTANPSMSGRFTSSTIADTPCVESSSASFPLPASATLKPDAISTRPVE